MVILCSEEANNGMVWYWHDQCSYSMVYCGGNMVKWGYSMVKLWYYKYTMVLKCKHHRIYILQSTSKNSTAWSKQKCIFWCFLVFFDVFWEAWPCICVSEIEKTKKELKTTTCYYHNTIQKWTLVLPMHIFKTL